MSWPMHSLESVADITGGGTPPRTKKHFWSGAVPWLTPTDLPALDSPIIDVEATGETISEEGLRNSSAKLLPAGSVCFSSRATIGKIGIAKIALATNQGFINFVPRSGIDSHFLAYALRFFTPQLAALAGSTTFHEINRSAVRKFKIPVPSLTEQRRIAEILGRADELRRKRREADEKAERILPALFYKMFGDPTTNPKRWPIKQLGALLSDTRNGLYKPLHHYGSGAAILKMFNIKDGWLDLTRVDRVALEPEERHAYGLERGDILLNRVNTKELVGKCAVIVEGLGEAVFESKNIRVRVNRRLVEPEFVAFYLNTPAGHKLLCRGVKHAIGMATINSSDLAQTPFFLPPLELQRRWRDSVHAMAKVRRSSAQSRDILDRVFRILMHRAFSGELTSRWREAHAKELLAEIEQQAHELKCSTDRLAGDSRLPS